MINIIEKLEYFQQKLIGDDLIEKAVELQNIIEEAKKKEPVASISFNESGEYTCIPVGREVFNLSPNVEHMLFTHPQLSDETVKDAARYRWLRQQNELLQNDAFVVLDRDVECEHCESTWVGVDLDLAIDEAMKAENDKG